jgi:hypothetical protein
MLHGFLQMRGLVPDAQAAAEEIARALDSQGREVLYAPSRRYALKEA